MPDFVKKARVPALRRRVDSRNINSFFAGGISPKYPAWKRSAGKDHVNSERKTFRTAEWEFGTCIRRFKGV
jgi:hypothetical protein